ncbi:hypothetical protein NIES2135_34290 [Leptolyngbya boryana NIES-2135]|jgi:hypothetical protein|uniref:Uncharacterized protein n=1 Tax=Leptolyngbya boryana NIES-2135 TaxID=1973484 RepID=A0A1Z4JIJ5_LEPBY|nr:MULTISPECIES: hypothetical protein [Leptolyngbya]BAY56595.1 hypothetical protein NIES2135_34290 [Leptolyngbya boryana NIES-2135]MBD2369897.1 hypothetical protein [Leptolyngbya sp. FACHB-161]MBD2376158.1 hypothetical protein [Leptolyngbya sp. FACHB-238]MBD2400433.1 hypothetical protein [Leptolyngbya sp. FACHB-239]MBD2406975.1 hypothetical protein [Leptolyngbya sp. FACHB-402]
MNSIPKVQFSEIPDGIDPELYKEVAIAAFQGLLSNSGLIQSMQAEDFHAIAKYQDFDPWQNRIAYLALECTDSYLRRLVKC